MKLRSLQVDVLVAEIGSTTTVVNAFHGLGTGAPRFCGQGQAATSVSQGDVRIGLRAAMEDLRAKLGLAELHYKRMLATSSAAGGLRMTVHGLVYDMTVRAGREAALGAGANIHLATAGKLQDGELAEILRIRPNLILLAGGTDYGDRDTALHNAEQLANLPLRAPVIYAGNIANQRAVREIFARANKPLTVTENVYPRLDELNIEPVRRVIHREFETHITAAPGMAELRQLVDGPILPTPGAVMECARLLYAELGDLIAVDVGGATTDIHSVAEGSEEIAAMQTRPEPLAKRSVEGDLGLFVNAASLADLVGRALLRTETGLDVDTLLSDWPPIPQTEEQQVLAAALCRHAAQIAMKRHAGQLRHTYGATGRQTWAEGKDLSRVRTLIATGGALTRLGGREQVLCALRDMNPGGMLLYPKPATMRLLQDGHYIMASLGVLSLEYPRDALILMQESLGVR